MDSLSTQKAKPKKMNVVVKKSRVQILLDLLYRVIEITVVMVTVAKLCYQLVITLESSRLTTFLINRHLAFVLGNAIVIALVAKCGFFVNQEPEARRNSNDFYDEFVRESSRGERSLQTDVICRENQTTEENRAKQSNEDKRQSRAKQSNEDKRQSRAKQSSEDKRQSRAKQSMSENRAKQSMSENRAKQSTEDKREKQKKTDNSSKQSSGEDRDTKDITVKRQRQNIAQNQEIPRKNCERSQSENLEGTKKSSSVKLKRSETERSADRFDSDDELMYKIESFIARQRRNQKDEDFCII